MDSQTQSVTRYRVTIDFTVINRGNPPSDWNWRNLLELNDNQYDGFVKNIYDYANFKIKRIKILVIIDNPIAVNNQGFLNIEKDLNINISDIKFSIPIF